MTAVVQSQYEIDIEDVEYLRHGDKPLLARVYKPRGEGPFPLIVDVHGGAWAKKNRMTDAGTDEPMAKSGIVVVALDFRASSEAPYPASMIDINYAVRWCKMKAKDLKTRPDMVGIRGVSSGGHQAMLTAMRPNDPQYATISLPGNAKFDASVRCAVMCWPVINPLGRYNYAKQVKASGDAKRSKHADEWIRSHDQYWITEAAMAEGNPTLALERGEKVEMPPVVYIQGLADNAHPKPDREQFIANYLKAGGSVELHTYEGVGEAFMTNDPTSSAALSALEKIIEFVHRNIH